MSKDVSVNKAFAKDEGETHELEEFTGKHLIETGDMGPAEEIEIPAFVATMKGYYILATRPGARWVTKYGM